MKRWMGYLITRASQTLGVAGWIGLGALAVALAVSVYDRTLEPKLQAAQQAVHGRQAAVEGRRAQRAAPVAVVAPDAWLPERTAVPAILKELHRIAALVKLDLPQAQYRWLEATDTAPLAYEITLPLKGRYPVIRAFLSMALNAVPALALRELTFKRPIPEVLDLETTVRLVLFVREPM